MKIEARPWQPQDLIDDLQAMIDEEPDNYTNERWTTLCMARDFLKEHFAEQKWIPVTERLPEPSVMVLACRRGFKGKRLSVECINTEYKDNLMWSGDYKLLGQPVTHWMPLPEAPKEVEG